jgi:cell division protein FtsI (penicillin-binding protein 3)
VRSADLRVLHRRLRVAQVAIAAGFAVLTLRAAHLSLWDERGARRGENQLLSAITLPPERGRILDRGGADLALTVQAPSIYAVPAAIEDRDAAARALAGALRIDAGRVSERLAQGGSFVFVRRWVDEDAADRVRALELPGVGIVGEPRRAYPLGPLGASVLGFANIDGVGARGIEQQENDWLFGHPRRVAVERDARGRLLLGTGLDPNATAGGDVLLTLDAAFQAEAEVALEEAVQASGARGGFAISLDPRTGEILALAERPGFDPNHFRLVPYAETRSRAFLDVIEPGSTFKAFLAAASLEAGTVGTDEVFDLRNGVSVPGKRIRDLHPRPELDLGGILRVSSNVGAVMLAQRLGPERHFEALRRFGFGASTQSGFPEESSGLLRSWQDWKPVDHATIAFGQGVSVTPIQLAAAMAALGNGGTWVTPHLVKARRRPSEPWEPVPAPATRQAVSPRTAATVCRLLEGVVSTDGTGRRAQLRDVRVAGKTGTAQKLDPATGRYSDDRYWAWFIGLAPAEQPRVAIVVGIDEPQGRAHGGGDVAAPAFARIAAAHLTALGIPTEPLVGPPRPALPETRVAAAPHPAPPPAVRPTARRERAPERTRTARPAPRLLSDGDRIFLPDLHGLTVEQVRGLAANAPLVFEILGHGRAVEQDPAPGTILAAGQWRVRVRFEPDGAASSGGGR